MESNFSELGLSVPALKRLGELGFSHPRPVQEKAIPPMMRGENVVAQAQTGSGKTLAFALPILEKLDVSEKRTQALVLAPTRELCLQICQVFWEVRPPSSGTRVVPVYGGASKDDQRLSLRQGAHVIVATPGRFLDFLWEGEIVLDAVRILVLDEADRMLEMGFIDDVKFILDCLPKTVQMGLFSATIPNPIRQIIQAHVPTHVTVRLDKLAEDKPKIRQICCGVPPGEKVKALARLLRAARGSTLIFCRTRGGADLVGRRLNEMGVHVGVLHGGKSQGERDAVMRRFRSGRLSNLVATDIASRGLDIEGVEQVVNFDVVHANEDYLHRIGRTGRAGKTGIAVTFFTPSEKRRIKEIEKSVGEEFEYCAPAEFVSILSQGA